MKVGGFLPVELALHSAAVLRGAEPLKTIIDELSVLLVKVLMGHHVRGACIDLVTTHLHQAKTGSQSSAQHFNSLPLLPAITNTCAAHIRLIVPFVHFS